MLHSSVHSPDSNARSASFPPKTPPSSVAVVKIHPFPISWRLDVDRIAFPRVGAPPLGGRVGNALHTKPPKGGTPTCSPVRPSKCRMPLLGNERGERRGKKRRQKRGAFRTPLYINTRNDPCLSPQQNQR